MNNIQKLLSLFAGPIQDLEDQAWLILNGMILGNATGDQLDKLGAVVGESRGARSDTDYRTAIRLRIRANRSKGRAEDLIDVARLAAVNSVPYYAEFFPAAWEVLINNLPGGLQVARFLGIAKMAGTAGVLTYTDDTSAGGRWMNDGDTPGTDETWEDDVSPTINYRIDIGAGGT